ncbi:MAG: ADP-ribosylglycohydrolase family protein [Steroidobacteraceae bacterium]
MLYSLLARFQGGLLGSAIAEIVTYPSTDKSEPSLRSLQLCLLPILLESGYVAEIDWREIYQKQQTSGYWNRTPNSSELAVLTMPLALFFHDSASRLETQLSNFLNAWGLPQESLPELLLWGQIISLALRGKLQPSLLIPQLLDGNTPFKPQLERVQRYLERDLPLTQAIADLQHAPPQFQGMAAALFCFASVPEDFRLSTLRAVQGERQLAGVAALTGSLAGAYNSVSGIPVPWRLAAQNSPALQEIPQQAKSLLATWSGNYYCMTGDFSAKLAVAAAGTIQPRHSWRMISQR